MGCGRSKFHARDEPDLHSKSNGIEKGTIIECGFKRDTLCIHSLKFKKYYYFAWNQNSGDYSQTSLSNHRYAATTWLKRP